MRKLLFMMLALLSVLTIKGETFGKDGTSSWTVEGSVMRITIGNAGDFGNYIPNAGYGCTLVSAAQNAEPKVTKVVVTTAEGVALNSEDAASFYFVGDAGCITTIDFMEADFSDEASVSALNLNPNSGSGNIRNIIVSDAYASTPGSFWNNAVFNYYGRTHEGLIAVINNTDKLAWNDVRDAEPKLILQSDVTSEFDLSASGFTEFNFTNINISADITVPAGSAVSVADESAKAYIKGTDNVKVEKPVAPADKNTLATTVENLKTDFEAFVAENGKDALKKLIITEGTITQDVLDYIAENLKDITTLDLTNATLPDGVRMKEGDKVNWEVFILPVGTKISPNFKGGCYPNLKFAMAGGFNKIWLVSQRAKGESSAFGSILDMIPAEIKNQPAENRMGVAFVGEVTVDDVLSVAGSHDAPLANARIWHFLAATGLTMDDFATGGKLLAGLQGNNDNPTGLVLMPGADVDKVGFYYALGNIYSLSEDERTLTVKISKTHTFDIARFTTMKTRIAVLKNAEVDEHIINALKGTRRAVSVDLSGMSFPDNSDEILSGVTAGNVKVVRIPNGCGFDINHYAGTTFGVISRIKTDETPNVAVSYQRVPGTLNKVREYRSSSIINSEYIRYRGVMNMHDIENIFTGDNSNTNTYYDLSDVRLVKYINGTVDEEKDPIDFHEDMITDRTVEDGRDMSGLKNDYVKYIALPEGTEIPANIDAFKTDNCPLLLCIGTFDKASQKLSFHSFEEGCVEPVVKMLVDDGDKITADNVVKNLVMSGKLRFSDIAANDDNYGKDGHFGSEEGVADDDVKPNAAFSSGNALLYMQLSTADFSNAVFPTQTDMVFSRAARYSDVTEFKLPTSAEMTVIPDNCMNGFSNIQELCVPANYEVIGENAFREMTGLKKMTTTRVQEGNVTDRGEKTIVLSANLKEIKYGAFWGINGIYDVYVLAEKAPLCVSGAFDEAMLYGNNGFKNVHPIQRVNYINGERVIGVLHYPRVCAGTDEEKNYTDITREYTLLDETGAMNGEGELIAWPKHEEFGRSWAQARKEVEGSEGKLAYTWNAWAAGASTYEEAVEKGGIDNTCTYNTDYMGWHEFVLAESYHRKAQNDEQTRNYSRFKENDWYTLCVPYNITRSMLRDILGAEPGSEVTVDGKTITAGADGLYPDVRTLVQVKRSRNKSLVTFVFSDNLAEKEVGGIKGADVVIENDGRTYRYVAPEFVGDNGDDPVIIKGGYPYIVKPYLPADKLSLSALGEYLVNIPVVGNSPVGYTVNGMSRTATAAPYPEHKVHAIDEDKSTADAPTYVYLENNAAEPYFYHFIGTYSYKESEIPMYGFFLGVQKNTKKHLFFRATSAGREWTRYSALMAGRSAGSIVISPDANEDNIYLDFSCDNDYFGAETGTPSAAKVAMSFGDDGNTTGIIDINNVEKHVTGGAVYSISGKYMGTSVEGLPKGAYIMDGRKFVVR